jgi:hypothetical protein
MHALWRRVFRSRYNKRFGQLQQFIQQDWPAPLPGQRVGNAIFKPSIVSAMPSFGQDNFLPYIHGTALGVNW